MKSTMKVAALFGVLAWLALGASALADETIDQRLPADPRGAVQITATGGDIRCIGWDKPEVEITGEISGSAAHLDAQREGNTINIRIVMRSPSVHWSSDARLTVKMPAASGLRISAVGADVDVKGVTGEQRLLTVSGGIDTEAAGSDIELKSLSGDIKVQGKGANVRLTASTVSGNTTVRKFGGDLVLDTVSGEVNADMSALNRVKIKSISGELSVAGKLNRDSRVDISSVSGDMRMRWLGSEAANIEIETISGEITSCFGNSGVSKPSHGPGHTWRYNPANASSDIHVKSMSGEITICNK